MADSTENVVGVVLAGGDSRRMGFDKASLEIDAQSLTLRAVRLLLSVCRQVVVADRGRGLAGKLVRSVPDGPGKGPAAGILGAAAAHPGATLLVLACDLPKVDSELVQRLLRVDREEGGVDLVVTQDGATLQPVCALYRPSALKRLRSQVGEGRYALQALFDQPDLHWRSVETAPGQLANLNTPEDVARWFGPEALL